MRKRFSLSVVMLMLTSIIWAYDFSIVNEIGLTVYFEIIDSKNVRVCKANYFSEIRIPSTVEHNGNIYNVTEIGDSAFMNCDRIPIVSIPNSVKKIGDKAFYWCDGLASIKMSNALTEIGDSAFYYCRTLKSVELSNTITQIGKGAFCHCVWIEDINIPNSLNHIEAYTFEDCTSLKTVNIPKSVKVIGEKSFYNSGISTVCLCEENPLNISVASNSFNGTDFKLYVPIGSMSAYRNVSPWNQISPGIEEVNIYEFVVDWNYRHGDVHIDAPETCNEQIYSVTAEAYNGYEFNRWSDGVTDNPRSITVTQDTSLRAEFDEIYHVITVKAEDETMGITIGSDSYRYGDTIKIEAIPNTGFVFNMWSDGVTDNPRSIIVTQDTLIMAEFGEMYCQVAVKTNDEVMGNVIGSGRYKYGDTVEIEAIPTDGYNFIMWNDGIKDNPRKIFITQDTVVIAEFDEIHFVVNARAEDDSMGTVIGGGEYSTGSIVEVAAVAKSGYKFLMWNDGITENPRKMIITQDTTIVAMFEPIDKFFKVSVQSSDLSMGTVTGGGMYRSGEQAEIAAIAKSGYVFMQWNDGITENPRKLTVVQDTLITAEFKEETVYYTVHIRSNDESKGTVVGGGKFRRGESIEIAALAKNDYVFVKWDDGITANPRTLTVVQDTVIVAVFGERYYTITVESENEIEGKVIGGGNYKFGDVVTIAAIPEKGYYFEQWSDGIMDNPRFLTVKYDERIIAYFEVNTTHVKDVSSGEFVAYGRDGAIEVVNAKEIVEVYDVAGRKVYKGFDNIIYIGRAGVYIVRHGVEVCKVVVR